MNQAINKYIESLLPERDRLFKEMEQFAEQERVPIMEQTGMDTLLQFMRIQNPKKILEIGTAIGYSALRMSDALPEAKIITLEIDPIRVEQANQNIKAARAEGQVTVLEGDALELIEQVRELGPYEAIFIDAAKGQYMNFFNMYSPLLTDCGCIYSDNVLFRGYVAEDDIDKPRFRSMIKKMKMYNQTLMEKTDFITTIISTGDGLAVSKKK